MGFTKGFEIPKVWFGVTGKHPWVNYLQYFYQYITTRVTSMPWNMQSNTSGYITVAWNCFIKVWIFTKVLSILVNGCKYPSNSWLGRNQNGCWWIFQIISKRIIYRNVLVHTHHYTKYTLLSLIVSSLFVKKVHLGMQATRRTDISHVGSCVSKFV